MQNQSDLKQFQQALQQNGQKLLEYVKKLVHPENYQELRQNCKKYFIYLSSCLKQSSKQQIDRIAKFIILLIMSGHLHILYYLDKFFIPNIMEIGSGVLKFKALSPTLDKNTNIEPKKWRIQFVGQLLYILAEWFPKDLINNSEQSLYVKTIREKKIIIKGYFVLNIAFVQQVEQIVCKSEIVDEKVCYFCKKCYQNVKKQQLSQLSPRSAQRVIELSKPRQIIFGNYGSQIKQNSKFYQTPYFNQNIFLAPASPEYQYLGIQASYLSKPPSYLTDKKSYLSGSSSNLLKPAQEPPSKIFSKLSSKLKNHQRSHTTQNVQQQMTQKMSYLVPSENKSHMRNYSDLDEGQSKSKSKLKESPIAMRLKQKMSKNKKIKSNVPNIFSLNPSMPKRYEVQNEVSNYFATNIL